MMRECDGSCSREKIWRTLSSATADANAREFLGACRISLEAARVAAGRNMI